MSEPSRRDLLKTAAAAGVSGVPIVSLAVAMEPPAPFVSLLRHPDLVRAFGPRNHEIVLSKSGDTWKGGDAEISIGVEAGVTQVSMRGQGVDRIQLRWRGDLTRIKLYLGDHWERSYGDLEWRGEAPNRVMPWYFLAHDGKATHGYGVRTGARAMCFWTAEGEGISLWVDVRSGGVPVELPTSGRRSLPRGARRKCVRRCPGSLPANVFAAAPSGAAGLRDQRLELRLRQ